MPEKENKRTNVTAARWGLAGTGTEFVLQFLVQVYMARMLGPDIYGLAALGVLVVGLCNLLCQGWSWGVVQAKEISDDQVRAIFTWQSLFGLSLAALMAGLAHWIALWFQEPRAVPVLQAMALLVLISALTSTPVNLAKRQMDFRYLQLCSVSAYVVGYVLLGLPLAYAGYGIVAPVAAALGNSVCVLVVIWSRPGSRVRPLLAMPGGLSFSSLGLTAVATNACNWLLNSLDRMILGRLLAVSSFGNYAVGSNLANVPANVMINALQPTFLAVAARMQDDLPRLRRAYMGALATTLVVLAPLFVLLAVLAPDLIAFLYGPKWEHAHIVLQVLSLAMPAYISWGLSTPVLWSTGKKHWEIGLQLPLIPLAAVAFWLSASHGMQALAACAAGIMALRGLTFVVAACRQLGIGAHELLSVLARCAVGMLLTAAISLPTAAALREQHWTPLALGLGVCAAVLPLLAALACRFPAALGTHASQALVRLAPPLKAVIPAARP